MSDIFDEADSELKQEKLDKLLDKSIPYIICMVVVIIAATCFYVVWQKHVTKRQAEFGDIYNKTLTLLKNEKDQSALESLNYLVKKDNNGYACLARFKKAELLIKEGKIDEAVAIYDAIESSKPQDQAMADLASLLATSLLIENDKEDNINERFKRLERQDHAFRGSALLLKAGWLLKHNDNEAAIALLKTLIDNEGLIQAIRTKAEALLAITEEGKKQ
jgi:hypothetical protein